MCVWVCLAVGKCTDRRLRLQRIFAQNMSWLSGRGRRGQLCTKYKSVIPERFSILDQGSRLGVSKHFYSKGFRKKFVEM